MANCGQIRLEVAVAEGDEFVVNLLGAVVSGADWKPVFFVWDKGNPNRLPEIDVLSFGICMLDAVPSAAPLWNWFKIAIFLDKIDCRQKKLAMENSIPLFAAAKVDTFLFLTSNFFCIACFTYQNLSI